MAEKELDSYKKFGEDILGPFLYAYIIWLQQEVASCACDKILFFSRDGYMMHKAYCAMNVEKVNCIPARYVYFSRNSLRNALICKSKNYIESLKYISKTKYVSVLTLLNYYGYDNDEAIEACKEIGVDENYNIEFANLKDDKIAKKIYTDCYAEIQKRSLIEWNNLECYINDIGLNENSAIVDIGWHASMQYYLEEFFRLKGNKKGLKGFYVGTRADKFILGTTKGFVYDDKRGDEKELLSSFGLFEKFFQSQEGSTLRYSVCDGMIEIIKEKYEYESDIEAQNKIIAIQDGAMGFIRKADEPNIDFNICIKKLLKVGKSPSVKDIGLFKFLYTTDGERAYFLPQKALYKYNMKEFITALQKSSWKTGFLKAAFRVPFPYYYVYKALKK